MNPYVRTLALLSLVVAVEATATITTSLRWKEVAIVSNGPASAGEIRINAKIAEDGGLFLRVQSNYGDYELEESITRPQIESITVHSYSEDSLFPNLFFVCMYFGESARVNLGSEENPDYEWKYNKLNFAFFPGRVEKTINKNNDRFWLQDCDPG